MIWLKRAAPFVMAVVLWFGGKWYMDRGERVEKETTDRYALVTAQVWVARARFRNDSTQFLAYRDSLLAAETVSIDEIREFGRIYEEEAEVYHKFSKKVSRCVDSLVRIEDSLRVAAVADSIEASVMSSEKPASTESSE